MNLGNKTSLELMTSKEVLAISNINTLVRALGALFILNVYHSFQTAQMDVISEFDFSMGSNVFMAKYSIDSYEPNAVLIVLEDAEYLKKVQSFVDLLPDIESDEFLKHTDEIPTPQRYIVKINK